MKKSFFTFLFSCIYIINIAQTTHTINLPSSGAATINVNCTVGDILLFKSTSTPLAIRVFRNPAPNFTVTPTGLSTSYTVTATDTSYSSIVSLSPVTTCVGKITLSTATSLIENVKSDLNLNLFPNPTSSIINIEGLKSASQIYVYDINGKNLLESKIEPDNKILDLSPFNVGVYFIRVNNRYFKIIKIE